MTPTLEPLQLSAIRQTAQAQTSLLRRVLALSSRSRWRTSVSQHSALVRQFFSLVYSRIRAQTLQTQLTVQLLWFSRERQPQCSPRTLSRRSTPTAHTKLVTHSQQATHGR